MKIAVALSPRAGVATEWTIDLAEPATALDAILASGLAERFPEIDLGASTIGLWGRACPPGALLKDGDRVELYRPLAMDPNEARRLRARELRRKKSA
ncbi:MAG: RnfH family protein [Caldimonas sp.]